MEQVTKLRNPKLTPRDYAILKHIGDFGFSSARWIRDRFWAGKSNCIYYRRLSILRQLGLLEHMVGDGGNKLAYRLTKKGVNLLRSQGIENAEKPGFRASYRTTFNHDDYLVGLGVLLQSFPGVVEYWPEHRVRQFLAQKHGHQERKSDGYKVPDALFTIRTKQRSLRVALELEIAPKASAYYRRILRQLVTSRDFDMVFVITADSKIGGSLMEALAWVRANDPIVKFAKRDNGCYFTLLDEALANKGNAKFRGEGAAFTLSQLAS